MIVIRALDGTEVDVNENAITLIVGPYPHDLGPHTYVHGVDRGVLVTAEAAAALVARLRIDPPLGSAVTEVRAPLATELQGSAEVIAVVIVGGLHQAVREDAKTVETVLNTPAVTA